MNKKRTRFAVFLGGVLGFFGLLGSLYIVMHRPLDPDMFHSVLVWDGVRNNGINWLNDWRFTQDNWLFSLVPFQVFLVSITGNIADSILLSGWLIHILAIIVTALIARQLGAVKSVPIILVLLSLINVYGHWAGNISYPVSHNITNLIGLVTLWLTLKWLHQPSISLVATISVLQLLAGFSDPWLLPTYTLPLILGMMVLSLPFKSNRNVSLRDVSILVATMVMVFVLVKTRIFGWFTVMPVMHFAIGGKETILGNMDYLVRNIGGLFSFIYPIWNRDQHWPETQYPYAAISGFIIVASYIACTIRGLMSDRRTEARFILLFAAFSVGGICLAYMLSDVKASLASRFVINLVYLIPIVIAVVIEKAWPKFGSILRALIFLGLAGLALGGAISQLCFILYGGWPPSGKDVGELTEMLEANGLNYGYGPYHEAKTNAVTVLSQGRVAIRPVSFDQKTGRVIFFHPQTDVRWYTPNDAPPDQKYYFVYLRKDTAECPNYLLCRKALLIDFGEPQREIPFNNGSVLVWDHPLLEWGDHQPIQVTIGKPINFNDQEINPQWSGWAAAETWGTWSIAEEAFTRFELPAPLRTDLRIRIVSQAYAPYIGLEQQVEVYANGQRVGKFNYTPQSNLASRELIINKSYIGQDNMLNLVFKIRDPRSPKDMGVSPDNRKLGIGLVSINFASEK